MKVLIIVVTLIVFITAKKSSTNTRLVHCLHDILEKYPCATKKTILINFNIVLKYPLMNIKAFTKKERNVIYDTTFDIVIFDDRLINVTAFVLWDSKRAHFNANVSYIVLTHTVSSKIFQVFNKYYITKVYIIDRNYELFFNRPYIYESVDKPDTNPLKIGSCVKIPENVRLFETPMPRLWRNTTLRDCFRVMAPFTTDSNDGLENKFIQLVQQQLGAKRKTTILPNKGRNMLEFLSAEGTRMLRNMDADILFGFNSPMEDTVNHFDISSCIYSDAITWITPNPLKMSHWKRIFQIFSLQVWLTLLISALLWIFIINYIHIDLHLIDLSFIVFRILLEHSVSRHYMKKKLSFMTIMSAWMIAFLVISTLFKNSLLVILGTEKRVPELCSLKSILAAPGIKMASYVDLSKLYLDVNNHLEYPLHFKQIEHCTSAERCVNRTAFQTDLITVAPKSIVRYNWIPKYYINSNGEVLVKVSREVIRPFFIHLIFSKGYPLFPQINDILIRMKENGWFTNAYDEMRLKIKRRTNHLVFEAQKMGMSKFEFVFIMWAFGLFISFITFCFEIVIFDKTTAMKSNISI